MVIKLGVEIDININKMESTIINNILINKNNKVRKDKQRFEDESRSKNIMFGGFNRVVV